MRGGGGGGGGGEIGEEGSLLYSLRLASRFLLLLSSEFLPPFR